MKTEISRDSHQPKKRYSGVYQQQGRMLTDADWNELVEILKERLNDALKDVVGNGSPLHRNVVNNETDPPNLQWGYVYVDGIQAVVRPDEGATLQPAFEYDHQEDFPSPPDPTGDYVLYADVWERTVTHLMDERLRDKGLHGADTCTRKQTMAQVKWCPDNVDPEQPAKNPPKGNAELSITLLQKTTQPDPCDPCAAQLGVESKVGNYLFRIEVHDVEYDANGLIGITLKWSSENGAEQFEAKATKERMPDGFIDVKFVYEFFNENSEKHLGVHLASNTTFPDREVLHKVYPELLPGGFDFVRRWDGYATFKWDTLNEEWLLHDGISGGVDLTEDSSSTKADKVLKLDSVELKLQLLNRVIGGPVTSDNLKSPLGPIIDINNADLVINRKKIGRAKSSAKDKAAAINRADAAVIATANTVLEGSAPSEMGRIEAGQLIINTKDIGPISAAVNAKTQADAVVNAINEKFSTDDYFGASKTPEGAILLTATDGRNIEVEVTDVEVTDNETSRRCGFEQGKNTHYGSITLTSRSNSYITIAGKNPEYAGFVAGTTPAVQFVAGDYWLTEVREVEHKAGSVLIENKAPQGIEHHYLTLGTVKGGVLKSDPEADRKYAFPPLTEMTRMFMAGGDGQEAMPSVDLPYPIQVGVANGEWPVSGARVRFELVEGEGSLSKPDSVDLENYEVVVANTHVIVTSADGRADCSWTLGASGSQRVKATLLGPDDAKLDHPPVYFNANLSVASNVFYDASEKEDRWRDINEEEEGEILPSTVQEAIDDLADNLQSEDIKYTPDCTGDTPPTVRSRLEIPAGTSSRVHEVLDKLLCDFNATHLPIDKDDEEELCGRLKVEGIETVQDALDTLCRDIQWGNKHLHGWGVVCGLKVKCHGNRVKVEVESGHALDCDGHRLQLDESRIVNLVENAEDQGLLDSDGNGSVCLWIDHDQDHQIQMNIEAHAPQDFWDTVLEGTLLKDFFDDCILSLMTFVQGQFPTSLEDDPPVTEAQRRLTAFINLYFQLINPASGQYVFLSSEEDELLRGFYDKLKEFIASETFCAMFDNDRPFPDYTLDSGLDTIFGPPLKFSSRLRLHPSRQLAYTYGFGNKIYVYDLTTQELLQSLTFPSDEKIDVQDVAFASDGSEMYAVGLLGDETSVFATASILADGSHTWAPTTAISSIKVVSLAVSSKFPNNLYAIGKSQGLFILDPTNIPLSPGDADVQFNATGLLALSADGTRAFAALNQLVETETAMMTHIRNINLNNVTDKPVLYRIDGNDEENDISFYKNIVYLTGHIESNPEERVLVGYDITTGDPAGFSPVALEGATVTRLAVLGDTSGGEFLLVALADKFKVMRFDLATNTLDTNFRIPAQLFPIDIEVGSDGKAYVLNTISNTLTAMDITTVFDPDAPPNYTEEPPTENNVISIYQQGVKDAFSDLLSHLLQYLKDCFCDKFLIDCPDCTGDEKIYLGSVEIREGKVYNICNFAKRHYAKTFPTWSYWLSTVPILPLLKRGFGLFCCTTIRDAAMRLRAYVTNLKKGG